MSFILTSKMQMNADQGIRSDLSEGNENRLQINNNDKDLQTLQVVMANVPCSSETSVIMVTSSSQASVASDKVVENVNVNASTSGEEQTEGSVAKHSIVESYVKMIVCRKTTVKLVNVSTGEVLQTSCMTEEDEPVVLQVDRVESSETIDSEKYKSNNNNNTLSEGCAQVLKPLTGQNEEKPMTKRPVRRPRLIKAKVSAVNKDNDLVLSEGEMNCDSKSSTPDKEDCLEHDRAGQAEKNHIVLENRNEANSVAESDSALTRSIEAASSFIKKETSVKLMRQSIITTRKQAAAAAGKVAPAPSILHDQAPASNVQLPIKRGRGRPPKRPRLVECKPEPKETEVENKELPNEPSGAEVKERKETKDDYFDEEGGGGGGGGGEEEGNDDDDEDWSSEMERTQKQDKIRKATAHSCENCKKHFSSVATYLKHIKRRNCEATFYCKMCTKIFSSHDQLDRHMEGHRDQAENGNYHCRDCNRRYATRGGYMKHKRQGTCFKRDDFEDGVKGEFECEICKTHFRTESFLRLHKYKVHENPDNVYECHQCGRKFYSRQGYLKHEAAKSCTTPFTCPVCGKTYSNKARESFKLHMKHHRAEADGIQFQCEECGRTYLTEEALKKHRIKHTGLRPYKCSVCDKTFPMRYMVKDHERTHSGDKPFLCSMCGSSFSNRGHLYRHIRSHEFGTLHKRGRPKKNTLIHLRLPSNDGGDGTEGIVDDGTIRVMEIKTDPTQDQHDLGSSTVMSPTYITVHTAPGQVMLDSQVAQDQTQEVTMTEGQLQHVVMQAEGMSDPMVIQVIRDWTGSTTYHQVSESHAVAETHEILQTHRVVPAVSSGHHVTVEEKVLTHQQPQHHVVVTASQQQSHALIANQPANY